MESNFDFLKPEFPELHDAARRAERYARDDARASCIYARMALEGAVQWLYEHDKRLQLPYDTKLGALIHAIEFRGVVPEQFFHKAKAIQQAGNLAVHNTRRPVKQWEAQHNTRELFHALYWLARTYHRKPLSLVQDFNADLIPREERAAEPPLDDQRIRTLEAELERSAKALAEAEKELDAQREQLQEQVAAAREANEAQPDTHDYSEADTRKYLIDLQLARAGWILDRPEDKEYPVVGMPNTSGEGFVDYVLWGKDKKPLGLVEAKRTTESVTKGQQQAKLYADCLEQMHGQRPILYYTNGYKIFLWDDQEYPHREVSGYHTLDELELMVQRRGTRAEPDTSLLDRRIVDRYYQKRAIGELSEALVRKERKGLLVMATGTGKTRTAIALVDLLQRHNWVKRVLFLADRISLVKQAANAFKAHLPASSPVNLVTERNQDGRVYVCTYPTIMGLIDETSDGVARFGPGFFDLVIIDEAHRSVYQRYGAIFDYFDSYLIGLTATPKSEIDHNTYRLFDLEDGVPNDAYELEQAVADGFLSPPKAVQVDLKFPREGIRYEDLTDAEKEEWESIDWGDNDAMAGFPSGVNAGAINSWLFNAPTVDHVLRILMEQGHKVDGGDRLAKTIVFARNHDHAVFIEERFNHHYPHLKGSFARVIDNRVNYAQSLIDEFSIKDSDPHIAISVDMMDTGIDVPEVANLVFFKPVYSKTKFWQMIGRGTRLCENLFGEGQDKEDFRVFDFCFNFDYFRENPDGIENRATDSVSKRLFDSRVRILGLLDEGEELGVGKDFRDSVATSLRREIESMPRENFLVRKRLESVERFSEESAWERIDEEAMATLHSELAGLPNALEQENLATRVFDVLCLRMQLALLENNTGRFEADRLKVIAMAENLESNPAVPAIRAVLEYLQAVQTVEFWEGIGVEQIEELRVKLRDLAQFVEKGEKRIVYTDFDDELREVREVDAITVPRMTSIQYEKKVAAYLKSHQNDLAINKLRMNEPLTEKDLESLEETLSQIGEEQGQELLEGLLERKEAPTLPYFIRSIVGLDRKKVVELFSEYMTDRSLNASQKRFIELLIDQLTVNGVVEKEALYESPFSDLHDGGPDALFDDSGAVVDGVLRILDSIKERVS